MKKKTQGLSLKDIVIFLCFFVILSMIVMIFGTGGYCEEINKDFHYSVNRSYDRTHISCCLNKEAQIQLISDGEGWKNKIVSNEICYAYEKVNGTWEKR